MTSHEASLRVPLPGGDFWINLHNVSGSLFEDQCWTHCNSYCCKTNHKALNFSLMRCDSAGMVFPSEEYKFLSDNNLLQTGFAAAARHHSFEFDNRRRLSVKFVTSVCSLGGICSLPNFRPLICKLYPLYPDPGASGKDIEGFVAGSIIDQYWEQLQIEHPCWLLREKSATIQDATRERVLPALGHPYILFYLKAAARFVDHVSANARARGMVVKDADPRQFFKQWEISYLTGVLIDKPRLKQEFTAIYDAIASHFGEFEV
jgi:hypothetical protein